MAWLFFTPCSYWWETPSWPHIPSTASRTNAEDDKKKKKMVKILCSCLPSSGGAHSSALKLGLARWPVFTNETLHQSDTSKCNTKLDLKKKKNFYIVACSLRIWSCCMNKPGLSCWKSRDKCHSLHLCHSQQSAKPQKQTNLADQQLTENSE